MKILARFAALCLLAGAVQAQMAETLKSEFHKESELGTAIVVPEERGSLKSKLLDPNVRVLMLQLFQGDIDEAQAKELLEWVRTGHTLWFYDARLGPMFGFEPVLMTREQFTTRPEDGTLGGRKLEGVATVGIAMNSHVVNTGVGQVTAFLPKVDEASYGAVNVTGDTVPLLRFTTTSPAIAALRREGRGLIVFKPLLWPEALSGDRFQSNLLEYSAGFQVPGPAGEGKVGSPPGPQAAYVEGKPYRPLAGSGNAPLLTPSPSPSASPSESPSATPSPQAPGDDQLEVVGEGPLVGKLVAPSLRFETGTASLKLSRLEVESIELSQSGQLDVVRFRDGKVMKGLLLEKFVEMEVQGDTRKFERKFLRVIRWGKPS